MSNVSIIDTSSSVGALIAAMTTNITGDLFLTVLLFWILMVTFLLAFGMDFEGSIILTTPLLITTMAFLSEYSLVAGLSILYLAYLFARRLAA